MIAKILTSLLFKEATQRKPRRKMRRRKRLELLQRLLLTNLSTKLRLKLNPLVSNKKVQRETSLLDKDNKKVLQKDKILLRIHFLKENNPLPQKLTNNLVLQENPESSYLLYLLLFLLNLQV